MKKSEKTKNSQKTENQESVNQTEEQAFPKRQEPPRFQVQFDMSYGGTYVTKDGESMTVPDMNLTVRQLLKNHSRGLSNDRHLKDPLYFDIQIPKIKDITDVYEYKEYLKDMIDKTEAFLHDEKIREEQEKLDEQQRLKEQLEHKENKQLRIDEEAEGKSSRKQ